MNDTMKQWVVAGIALVAVLITTVIIFRAARPDPGSGAGTSASVTAGKKSVEQQIQAVTSNPHIPDAQKATIIAAIRMNSGQRPDAGAPQVGIATPKP